eukprot:GILJ01005747.1.p1 GENE.GILJ01005747.1~~GILJ01005747.1.p1  ORF type:complete len:276 (-),score=27.82 GILJ01005747.1:819-1646(-)
MGAKFSSVDEADAHLTFDSPRLLNSSWPHAIDGSSIKILVWNLKKQELAGMEEDLPHYGQDRDLLVLSEGYLDAFGRSIFNSLPDRTWHMGISFCYARRENSPPTGTMIASKTIPTSVKVKLSEDTEPIIKTHKCMTFATYTVNRRSGADVPASSSSDIVSLLVISIHGVNAVSVSALDRQLAQAAMAIRAHVGPVIFAGDFNTNLAVKVTHLRALIAELDMQEVETFRNDERKKVFGQIIDYVFSRGLRVKDAEVLAHLTSSDHKAMRVEFELI